VRTCENCGMNAVDSHGICQNCGWHEPQMNDSSPSLGETRAAEIPTSQAGARNSSSPVKSGEPGGAPPSPFERTVDLPRYSPLATQGSRAGTSGAPNTYGGTGRYCGTCGARIERGEVFCGQCGTPVGASGNSYDASGGGRSSPTGASSRYIVGDEDVWSPAHGDALTEAMVPSPPPPIPAQYNRGAPGVPYNQYSATNYPASQENESARTTRIIWGVLCLVASLLVAGAAVLVAVHR
jgi:hypothetical protein